MNTESTAEVAAKAVELAAPVVAKSAPIVKATVEVVKDVLPGATLTTVMVLGGFYIIEKRREAKQPSPLKDTFNFLSRVHSTVKGN